MSAGTSSSAHASLLLLEELGDEEAFARNSPWRRDAKGRFPDGSDELACDRVFDAYLKASNARTGRFDRRPHRTDQYAPDPADVDEQPDDDEAIVDAAPVEDDDDQELELELPEEDEEEDDMQERQATIAKREKLLATLKTLDHAPTTVELAHAAGLEGESDRALDAQVRNVLGSVRGTVVDWKRGQGVFFVNGHAKPKPKANAQKIRGSVAEGNGVRMTLENGPPLLPPAPHHVNGGGVVALLKSKEAELEAELAIIRRMLAVVT